MKMSLVVVLGFVSTAVGSQIYLVADTNMPDPNQEVTVYVHTDSPLYILSLWGEVAGDANITSAMGTADCNQYGWSPGWDIDCYFDADGWIGIGGIAWPDEADDIVGYFKFVYHSGQVSISISEELSLVTDANSKPAELPVDPLLIGLPDPNQMMQGEASNPDQIAQEPLTDPETTNTVGAGQPAVLGTARTLSMTPSFAAINCPEFDATIDHYEPPTPVKSDSNVSEGEPIGMALSGDVELSEITQSTILDPSTVYYVPNPPLLIHSVNGQEIDVVIPSDTTMIIAQDWDHYGIVVYDGANVHFGAPSPLSIAPPTHTYPGTVECAVPPVWGSVNSLL